MNRLHRKKRINLLDIFIFLIFISIPLLWFLFKNTDVFDTKPKIKMYNQETIDSLVSVINSYKESNDLYYDKIISLQETLNTLELKLNSIQDTLTKINTKKHEKPVSSRTVINGEVPSFLPNRYN